MGLKCASLGSLEIKAQNKSAEMQASKAGTSSYANKIETQIGHNRAYALSRP